MITDMTVGSPRRILFRFCLPMLASVAFQQFYGMVDSIVVGKCSPDPVIADNAVAAVGVSVPVTLVFMAIATGANIGCSVLISQLFGAKNYRSMRTAVHTSVIAVLTASLLLTAAGLIFGPAAARAARHAAGDYGGQPCLPEHIYRLAVLFIPI